MRAAIDAAAGHTKREREIETEREYTFGERVNRREEGVDGVSVTADLAEPPPSLMVTPSPSPLKEEKREGHGFAVVDPCMAEERKPEEECEAQPSTSHHLAFVLPENSFIVARKHHSNAAAAAGDGCRSCCCLVLVAVIARN
ncbi:hypothetical protein PIB30_081519 [Stylosanthes scabra]|uniref:Uncharacterized protein n=1 Tax=Stylosanthes scabra TaxID=79078 RepID=A0ABU6RSG6_9FABA|nr:hypothetical protein [Stylosanthes scabra]